MPMVIGIDHGFYAIKGAHVVFPSGLAVYDYEPYTMQNVLQYEGKYYVCGTGRQALLKDKTVNDNYYLLTMAALAQELRYRNAEKRMEIVLAAGIPDMDPGREAVPPGVFRHCAAPGVCEGRAFCSACGYRWVDLGSDEA